MTPQWRQLAAAQVLAGLLCYEPALSWTIDPTPDGPPVLEGTPHLAFAGDDVHRAQLAAWAQILESPVLEEQYRTFTGLSVRTTLNGVQIHIFTHVGVTIPALDGAL